MRDRYSFVAILNYAEDGISIEFPDLPLHVRLNEQGGNERTVTVALSALLDTRQWKPVKTADILQEETIAVEEE